MILVVDELFENWHSSFGVIQHVIWMEQKPSARVEIFVSLPQVSYPRFHLKLLGLEMEGQRGFGLNIVFRLPIRSFQAIDFVAPK
jgi:hypothetical protein